MPAVVDLIALTLLPLRRWRLVAEHLQAGHTPSAILEQQCDEWAQYAAGKTPCPGVNVLRSRAAAALDRAGHNAIEYLPWSDPRYPAALAAIADPPPVLWIRGCLSAVDAPSVAIVGSRSGSPYALAVAERLAADLVERGPVVTIGLGGGV